MRAHDRVVVGERARIAAVEPDPADAGGEVEHDLRPLDRVARLLGVAQVVFGRSDHPHKRTELLELADRGLPEEAAPAGDGYLPVLPEARIGLRGGHPSLNLTARRASWSASVSRSASTMIRTSSLKVTVGFQSSRSLA